ncbi:MAG: tyrosine--tRNA ligase [Phycisphaerales bacterium]|nr:MAG: tyrosine--tRNA ligase [Phycisphaerales bacterium]
MDFLRELDWRGLLHQTTAGDELVEHLSTPGRIGYCGFDPTSDSLTIGNFIPIKMLMHFQRAGHKPIAVMGGGTGLIGDPSGRDTERQLNSREQVEANVASQKRIMERLLDFSPSTSNSAVMVNNLDWLDKLGYIQVLRDVGKHFSVNEMIQRDSVKKRLEQREQGMSYTEFSYMLLQAYDFLHLRREMNCTCQIAGSDQYGNIVAGIDLIRREYGAEDCQAYGVTAPLVTRSDGKKMSKSTGTAIWLSADTEDRTSPYAFYQYWINLPDADVIRWLKMYTLLEQERIEELAQLHEKAPHRRDAHRELARHMTEMVHGKSELDRAESASQALFTGDVGQMDAELLAEVFADVPSSAHDKTALEGEGLPLVELLPRTSLAGSKRQAREFLTNGAVSVNGAKVPLDYCLKTSDLMHGQTILIRRGKKNWHATQWS